MPHSGTTKYFRSLAKTCLVFVSAIYTNVSNVNHKQNSQPIIITKDSSLFTLSHYFYVLTFNSCLSDFLFLSKIKETKLYMN